MPVLSAGILLFRRAVSGIEILLVHPGGPLWARKDEGAWSIPKGVCEPGEDPLSAALREFAEETGGIADGTPIPLGQFKQRSGKIVVVWAMEGDFDVSAFRSNTFEMEWPPRSGRRRSFPEADRAEWLSVERGREKILGGQAPALDALLAWLHGAGL